MRADLDVEGAGRRGRADPGERRGADAREAVLDLGERLCAGRAAARGRRGPSPRARSSARRAPRRAASPSPGSGLALHGAAGAAGAGSRAVSNRTVVMSTPEMPSTSAWWVLAISAKRPPGQALHEPDLPQRLGAVEALREQPAGERLSAASSAGSRQRGVADVVVGVEVRVVGPHGPALAEAGRRRGAGGSAGTRCSRPSDVLDELLQRRRRALEDHHGAPRACARVEWSSRCRNVESSAVSRSGLAMRLDCRGCGGPRQRLLPGGRPRDRRSAARVERARASGECERGLDVAVAVARFAVVVAVAVAGAGSLGDAAAGGGRRFFRRWR